MQEGIIMGQYYDGTHLLSMKDINGEKPEIYICTTNRTGGKTTYFNRLMVKKFLAGEGKFALIYRFAYELDDCADAFFKDIRTLFFNGYNMRSEPRRKGTYHELFLYKDSETDTKNPGVSCGYAIPLNKADQIKKISHHFSDVDRMVFDEFQSETNNYCTDEISKFISVHVSVARGQGKQNRYVPVYMVSNLVTLLNPYYVEFDIATRLQANTKFMRGDGFVLEQGFVESAANAMKESAFNRAFKRNKQIPYLQQAVYLNDNSSFIQKINGASKYIATFKYQGKAYALRAFEELGVIYCDDRADITFPLKLSLTTDDHNINYVMLRSNQDFINKIRYYFDHGCFRFRDLKCKEVVLKALSY